MKIKRIHLLGLSILSGILLGLSWIPYNLTFLIFIGFCPLFFVFNHIIENRAYFSKFAVLIYTYPAFFVWNLITTYWIYNSTLVGAALAIIFNSLFMSIVFQVWYFLVNFLNKNSVNRKISISYFIFVVLWISYEYGHLNWELSWSWLQLGNVFANSIKLIQWYEYTGVLGGTLWVLIVNILLFTLVRNLLSNIKIFARKNLILITYWVLILVVPVLLSFISYNSYVENGKPVSIRVVQPNVDPYGEKFDSDYFDEIWDKLFNLSKDKQTSVDIILWPETSIPGSFTLDDRNSQSIEKIKKFLKYQTKAKYLISGADAYLIYTDKKTSTARYFSDGSCCWDAFNSAVQLDTTGLLNFYHKSKLVPGVERIPYPQVFGFLNKYAIDLGGTTGSLGMSSEPVVFQAEKAVVAPIICYESIFGEYVTRFVNKGANLIFIMTNDGWWGNTPGHKQHYAYAKLRAIENRRSIARSANTGISCFINQKGESIKPTKYWTEDVIEHTLLANDKLTFYAKTGDYIGRIAVFAFVLIIIFIVATSLKRKISRSL